MPSPRAVLADIHEFGLDPKKKHDDLTKKGRLNTNVSLNSVQPEIIVVEEKTFDAIQKIEPVILPEPEVQVKLESEPVLIDVIEQVETLSQAEEVSLSSNQEVAEQTVDVSSNFKKKKKSSLL